jgi:hypothetical protein
MKLESCGMNPFEENPEEIRAMGRQGCHVFSTELHEMKILVYRPARPWHLDAAREVFVLISRGISGISNGNS